MNKMPLSKKATDVLKALKEFEKTNIKELNPQRFSNAVGSEKAKPAQDVLDELILKNIISESLELTSKGDKISSYLH